MSWDHIHAANEPQLHLSSEIQSIQFFTAQNPVKSGSQTVLRTRICEHNFQKYDTTRVRGAFLGPFAEIETKKGKQKSIL